MGDIMCRQFARALYLVISAILLSSCDEPLTRSSGSFGPDGPSRGGVTLRGETNHQFTAGTQPGAMHRGTDTFIDRDAADGGAQGRAIVVPSDGENVQLSLVGASI